MLGGAPSSQVEDEEHFVDAVQSEANKQKRDLALEYILTSVDESCKAMVRMMRCPRKPWSTLQETFKAVSEACIDAKLLQLQARVLMKGKHIVKYSSRILELVSRLENAGHVISEVEQKPALLRRLPED